MRGRYRLSFVVAVAALVAATACSPNPETTEAELVVRAAVATRQLDNYYDVPVLAPPLPVLAGDSELPLESLVEAVAVIARAGELDSPHGGLLRTTLSQRTMQFTALARGSARALPTMIKLARALEMTSLDTEHIGAQLPSVIIESGEDRVDDESLISLGDDLHGLQHLSSIDLAESNGAVLEIVRKICEANRQRTFEKMRHVESYRIVDQTALRLGAECDLELSTTQRQQAVQLVEATFKLRLVEPQAPLFLLHEARWFYDRGLLSQGVFDAATSASDDTIDVSEDEYDTGVLGRSILKHAMPAEVRLDDTSRDEIVRHARGSGLFIPSQAAGELVLLADVNRMLGVEPPAGQYETDDPVLKWALGSMPGSGVSPVSTGVPERASVASRELGFTAGVAAVRYLDHDAIPESDRCDHALAADLTGTRQLVYVSERLTAECGIEQQIEVSDSNDGTLLSATLQALDHCLLGNAVPVDAEPFVPSEDQAMQMHIDELWATLVHSLVKDDRCDIAIG